MSGNLADAEPVLAAFEQLQDCALRRIEPGRLGAYPVIAAQRLGQPRERLADTVFDAAGIPGRFHIAHL